MPKPCDVVGAEDGDTIYDACKLDTEGEHPKCGVHCRAKEAIKVSVFPKKAKTVAPSESLAKQQEEFMSDDAENCRIKK